MYQFFTFIDTMLHNQFNKMMSDQSFQQEMHQENIKPVEEKANKITLDDDIPNSGGFGSGNLQENISFDQEFGNIFERANPLDQRSFNHSDSKKIFMEKIFTEKSGNTPRKIIEVFLDHFPSFRSCYPKQVARQILQYCNKLRSWHQQDKRNVYKFEQLTKLFVSIYALAPKNEKLSRQIFNTILRNQAISSLKKPRSQVQNKVHYLRVMKIFSLRCRSKKLIERNQAR